MASIACGTGSGSALCPACLGCAHCPSGRIIEDFTHVLAGSSPCTYYCVSVHNPLDAQGPYHCGGGSGAELAIGVAAAGLAAFFLIDSLHHRSRAARAAARRHP